jgi:transcriptional regulator with XRE-family HTH domain
MSRYRLLKRMLHAKGYNLPEVAELLGMSASSVSRRFRAIEPFNSDEMYVLMDAANAPYAEMHTIFPKRGIEDGN